MILHEHAMSSYAQKVRIMLREKGIAFETRTPEGIGSGFGIEAFAEISPRMEVPALETPEGVLFDSSIILEYLEETYPEPAMMPARPIDRARMRAIEEICDTIYEAINWGFIEVRYCGRGGDELGPRLYAEGGRQIAQLNEWLEAELGDSPWMTGEQFGWGDIVTLPFVATAALLGFPPRAGSRLEAWLKRGLERPSFAPTFAEAEATLPQIELLLAAVSSGQFRRQYRDHRLEWMIRSGGIDVLLDGLAKDNIRFTNLDVLTRRRR